MNDREAFEAWALMNVGQPDFGGYHTDGGKWFYRHNFIRMCWDAWQAALASERAKQAEPVAFEDDLRNIAQRVGGNAPAFAEKIIAAPPAAPAQQPHIDPITPDNRNRYYDFEKYADHLPTCKQPRGDQSCECGYSSVRTNLSDLLDELAAPAQQVEAKPFQFCDCDDCEDKARMPVQQEGK